MTIIAQAKLELRDPHDCTDASDELTIYHALYDTLVRRVGQDYVPHLAKSWSVTDDAKTWTFRLQDDVRFHDGSACDARAVAACLERMAREDKGYTLGAPAVWRQFLGDAIFGLPDPLTIVVTLAAPMADLLDVLEQGFIVAPSAFAAFDRKDYDRQIGSGPYRVMSIEENRIVAERIEDHFAGRPDNRTITWLRVPDPAYRLALLQRNEVQVANALDFEASRVLGGQRHEYLSPVAIIYLLNAASGPLADPRVRRAISLAVDRDAIIRSVLSGAARPLLGIVSPNHFGAGHADDGAGVDRQKARSLLAEAGYANGLKLGIDCPTRLPDEAVKLTMELRRQLAEVGIASSMFIHAEREDYAHMVRRKEIRDLCVFDSSPMSTYRVLHEKIDSRVAGSWWQGYANPKVEALIDKGRVTTDRAERSQIWQQTYALLKDDPAWLTLYNPIRVIGLSGDHPDFRMPADGVIDVARLPALPDA